MDGTPLLGLSGLARIGETDRFVAISDDTDAAARFSKLRLDLANGTLEDGDVEVLDVTIIERPKGPIEAHAPFRYRVGIDGSFSEVLPLDARYDQTVKAGRGVYNSGGLE